MCANGDIDGRWVLRSACGLSAARSCRRKRLGVGPQAHCERRREARSRLSSASARARAERRADSAQNVHLVVIVGLAGDPEHGELFQKWATSLVDAGSSRYGIPRERIASTSPKSPTRTGRSRPGRRRATRSSKTFEAMAQKSAARRHGVRRADRPRHVRRSRSRSSICPDRT